MATAAVGPFLLRAATRLSPQIVASLNPNLCACSLPQPMPEPMQLLCCSRLSSVDCFFEQHVVLSSNCREKARLMFAGLKATEMPFRTSRHHASVGPDTRSG